MNHHDSPRIGIDIGRVLLGSTGPDGGADTSFLSGSDERALATPPARGAFEALELLVTRCDGRVWLVSKCGPRIEALTRRWLERHEVHERTGMSRDHLRFCLRRPDKRAHAEQLGLTHFVDDRLDVLEHLEGVVPRRVLFGHQPRGVVVPPGVTPALDWVSALAALGFVEDSEELRRHLGDEPDAVGGEPERMPRASHRR